MKKDTIIAKDKEHLEQLIKECIGEEGNECDLNHIDTSRITDMSELFLYSDFHGDISHWNVSNVNDMKGMFTSSRFNGDISNWDVSNVNNMECMFCYSHFNGDISQWKVINVKNIFDIFYHCEIEKIPYWSKIENYQDRVLAIEAYLAKQELEKFIPNYDNLKRIHKI